MAEILRDPSKFLLNFSLPSAPAVRSLEGLLDLLGVKT